MRHRTAARVLTFGEAGEVTWRGLVLDDLGRPSFELGHAGEWREVRLTQSGLHQVSNAAAAGALARAEPAKTGAPLRKPGTWLADIRKLRDAGKIGEARASLVEFRKKYPKWVVPTDLAPLLSE
jgi:hypothetical protein